MKKFFLLCVAVAAICWFYEPIKNWGRQQTHVLMSSNSPAVAYSLPTTNFITPDPVPTDNQKPSSITLAEYTQQAHSDPNAYYKLFNCGQSEQERTEADKLINFLTHLKYE